MHKIINLIICSMLFLSCSSRNDGGKESSIKGKSEKISTSESDKIPPAVLENGELVYRRHCMACHQKDGNGLVKMYPPLSQTSTVNGDADKLIGIVLNGLTGEIQVKGEIYNHVMIPHNFLSDKEIADMLTYVRNNFGNSSRRIMEEEVAELRR